MKKLIVLIVLASVMLAACDDNGLDKPKAEKMLKDMVNKKAYVMGKYKDVRVTKVTYFDKFDTWEVYFVATTANGESEDDSYGFYFTGEKWCLKTVGGCHVEFSSSGDFLKEN